MYAFTAYITGPYWTIEMGPYWFGYSVWKTHFLFGEWAVCWVNISCDNPRYFLRRQLTSQVIPQTLRRDLDPQRNEKCASSLWSGTNIQFEMIHCMVFTPISILGPFWSQMWLTFHGEYGISPDSLTVNEEHLGLGETSGTNQLCPSIGKLRGSTGSAASGPSG